MLDYLINVGHADSKPRMHILLCKCVEFHRDSNPEVMLLGHLLKFDRLLFYRVHVHCSVILNWFNKLLLKALLISVFEENAN